MLNWLESIYSDGTAGFVSSPTPKIGESVQIRLRFLEDAPVKAVYLRRLINGGEQYIKLSPEENKCGLVYYSGEVNINEPRITYYFILACENIIYYYTQAGVTTYIPDDTYAFTLLGEYRQPEWVKGAVFYQIFPERFANGNPENDVKTGEYIYRGHKSIHMDSWEDEPLSWEQGRALDFFGGDLDGIREKIPYLKELGVTALYLNPIFEAYSTHKYDCTDYFHVDKHFGGDEALARLSAALHENNMRLMLDISINHTGIEHGWVKEGKPFYFKKEDGTLAGWAGVPTLPELDYRNEELRDLIYRGENAVLRKWLRPPYSIDGWRFDVADVFARNDRVQLADTIWKEVCQAIREENPDAFIIGEHWGDCAGYLQGDLWNTPMNYFGFGRIVRQFAGLPDLFLERTPELKSIAYSMTAADVVNRTREHYAKFPSVIADCQMNLFDSHDVPRIHNYEEISFEKWKSAIVAQLLWQGIPCIYYGDEVAIDGYTYHDAGFRFQMPWGHVSKEGERFYAITKKMTSLRREVDAFSQGSAKVLLADGKILAIARFFGDEVYVGVISMEETQREITLPLGLVGAKKPIHKIDVFGENLDGKEEGKGMYSLKIEPFASYLFCCE